MLNAFENEMIKNYRWYYDVGNRKSNASDRHCEEVSVRASFRSLKDQKAGYEEFQEAFNKYNQELTKEQLHFWYFISTTDFGVLAPKRQEYAEGQQELAEVTKQQECKRAQIDDGIERVVA